jgi:hypothetical protein
MLGFGSAVVGEALTGGGVLAQLGYQLGLQQVRCNTNRARCCCEAACDAGSGPAPLKW